MVPSQFGVARQRSATCESPDAGGEIGVFIGGLRPACPPSPTQRNERAGTSGACIDLRQAGVIATTGHEERPLRDGLGRHNAPRTEPASACPATIRIPAATAPCLLQGCIAPPLARCAQLWVAAGCLRRKL